MTERTQRPLISVVVPVFNEEANIRNFYDRLTAAAAGKPYDIEMILINDGSRDNSFALLKELALADGRVIAVNLSRNFGSYAAINAGWKLAKGHAVMCISADLQDPPEIINEFLPQWQVGYDIVWGVRAGRQDPFFKVLFARLFYTVLRRLAMPDFPRDGMDIGLFDRSIVEHYLALREKHGIPFVTIYAMGFRQARIPYGRKARVAGESGWPFLKRVKFAIDVVVEHSYVPIRLMTLTGVALATLSFLYGALLIVLKLLFSMASDGWTSLATLITFVGGVQMVFLGVISEYLWRMSRYVKSQPIYYIDAVVSQNPRPGDA